MNQDTVTNFKKLIKERTDAFKAVEVFAASNYPFSDEQHAEFLALEAKASAASAAFDEISTVRKI